ncbi:long-chain fatty acid--CoA ligase [Tumebacillus sp. DT12]|uniref:Long-chain fatty acid--CoA ligase n=1 Tax=Tumebacillus lacus TaxID=2995335 RepID=A0ABT3X4V8_9BACL|nr:long-chain fatty acid--CoA ligase [Tumebacillus lacus]MCX7571002.1 long-chain fatty acid--CoA ligase [Tumebacillus lacus]
MSMKSVAKGLEYAPPVYSLYECLVATATKHGDRPAVHFFDKTITHGELLKAAVQLSAFLHAKGVRKGDRVGIMLPNVPHYVIAFYACARLGAIVTQVNPMYTPREVEYTLEDSGSKALVVLDRLYAGIAELDAVKKLSSVIPVSLGEAPAFEAANATAWNGVMTTPYEIPDPAEIDPLEDIGVLQYTGGTTGRSKGAMLTHANLVANTWQSIMVLGGEAIVPEDKILTAIPLFHVYGMTVAMNIAIFRGCAMILMPRFDVQEMLEAIKLYRPRLFPGVPTMYVAIANHPDAEAYGIDAIEICNSGSAPLPVEVLQRFEQRTGSMICEGYGLSETSSVAHTNPLDGRPRKAGSIGVPIPGTEAKIVDLATGEEIVNVGEIGEMVVRGPQIMKGYWNMPEETAHALRDGWLYTGDIARLDEDGYAYIVDRKKDMIIAGGFNVYPRDVEEVLYQHPNVREAVVVGVPDEYRGENVKAFLVLKDGAEWSPELEEQMNQFCRERLAPYKVPRLYEVRAELPKTPVGKILRRALRA